MKDIYLQKCWSCSKACDIKKCIWVRTLKKTPPGAIKNCKGYIISCPNFEPDITAYFGEEITIRKIALKYNKSIRCIFRIKAELVRILGPITNKQVDLFLQNNYRFNNA